MGKAGKVFSSIEEWKFGCTYALRFGRFNSIKIGLVIIECERRGANNSSSSFILIHIVDGSI